MTKGNVSGCMYGALQTKEEQPKQTIHTPTVTDRTAANSDES